MHKVKNLLLKIYYCCKTFIIENWMFLLSIILAIGICIVYALSTGHYANFYAINGTYQNFNPVRRFLNGQIPYRDFYDYLGLGHLYVGSLFTVIFGSDYHASLIAFSFLTLLCMVLLAFIIGFAIFKRKELVPCFASLFLVLIIIQPLFFTNTLTGTPEILNALKSTLGTGNSARFVRGMILPLICFFNWIGYLWYKKFLKKRLSEKKRFVFVYTATGIIAGLAFTWSNDYGISCWVCLLIVTFWISLSRSRKFSKAICALLIELSTSIVSIFAFVELFTFGHFPEWLINTFGTGGYQSWYYNSTKSYYFYDVDFSFIMLLQAGLSIVYLIVLYKKRASIDAIKRYGILAFVNLTCFCAVNEYHLISGGESREVALSVLFFSIVFELIHFIGKISADTHDKEKMVFIMSFVLGFSWLISSVKDEIVFKYEGDLGGIYIETLGGNVTSLGEDLIKTNEFLNGKNFFATYASAQEVISNTFQPTGIDYIIHVLGDDRRKEYLEVFNEGDFTYAATINESYSEWEYWVRRANWFFYRELYSGWHPIYANTYETYWERNKDPKAYIKNEEMEIVINQIDNASIEISFSCDENVNGIADVYLDYEIEKAGSLVFRTDLKVEDIGFYNETGKSDYNYLRSKSAEYIPVNIIDGHGKIKIASNPGNKSNLILNNVQCNTVYTVASVKETKTANITNENWDAGCSISKRVLLFPYTDYLAEKLKVAECIKSDDARFSIKSIEMDDDWIRVEVDKDASICKYPSSINIE